LIEQKRCETDEGSESKTLVVQPFHLIPRHILRVRERDEPIPGPCHEDQGERHGHAADTGTGEPEGNGDQAANDEDDHVDRVTETHSAISKYRKLPITPPGVGSTAVGVEGLADSI